MAYNSILDFFLGVASLGGLPFWGFTGGCALGLRSVCFFGFGGFSLVFLHCFFAYLVRWCFVFCLAFLSIRSLLSLAFLFWYADVRFVPAFGGYGAVLLRGLS